MIAMSMLALTACSGTPTVGGAAAASSVPTGAVAQADATSTPSASPSVAATTSSATTATPTQAFAPGVNRVTFTSEGETLVGNLYLPPSYQMGQQLPAVVIAPTWTSVKEQMANRYAERLAQAGEYATLAFDFRGYGESSGEPRNYEDPALKVVDIRNAVTFLEGLPVVDGTRIGGLGICAGAGYMADAVAQDDRLRSLALIAPWLHNAAIVRTIYGGEEGVQQRLAAAANARAQFTAGGEVAYVPAISTTDQNAAMFGEFDYYLNPQRGAIPQWGNQFAVMAWQPWLEYNPVATAPTIDVPVLMVHSPDAAVPDGARQFYAGLTTPKRFVWLDGIQFDFYDQEAQVSRSVQEAVTHFDATLAQRAAPAPDAAIQAELQALRDQQAVIAAVNAVGLYADLDRWDMVQAQFADQVILDYTSYADASAGAAEPSTLAPAEVVAAWQTVLPGYDHTQHIIGNHQVQFTGDEALVTSSIYATHILANDEGEDYWVFIGDYNHRLIRTPEGWKIQRMQANMRAQLGNPNLLNLAQQRVQQRSTPIPQP